MLERVRSTRRLIFAYGAGLIVGNLIYLPYTGGLAFIFIIAGLIVALPFLGIALAVLQIFYRPIRRYILVWCMIAPLLTVITWLGYEWTSDYRVRGYDALAYLQIRNVLERAVLVLTCSSISALVFYRAEYNDVVEFNLRQLLLRSGR